MKNLFLILGIFFCVNVFTQEDDKRGENSLFDVGIGTSFRMGTLLMPSLDGYLSVGPVEIEGFWKYSEYNGDPLNSFGLGANIFVLGTESGLFFVNYDFVFDAETEVINYSPYEVKKDLGHIFCLGFQGSVPFFLKIGIMYNPNLKDSFDPRLEFGIKFYLNNKHSL